jgi:starvation-inducible DNA-binding protein
MKSKKVIENLHHVLADTYALYLKTQNYHWNVTGSNFGELHKMFQGQYDDLAEAVDSIAERIRALGAKVPATFKTFDKKCHIKDGNEKATWQSMVKELANDQHSIVKVLTACAKVSEASGDLVTMDLMIERMAVHQKNAWMLGAYTA